MKTRTERASRGKRSEVVETAEASAFQNGNAPLASSLEPEEQTFAGKAEPSRSVAPTAASTAKGAGKGAHSTEPTADKPEERSQQATLTDEDLNRRIAEQAFVLFVQRGYAHGHDVEDWLEAEQLVLSQMRQTIEGRSSGRSSNRAH